MRYLGIDFGSKRVGVALSDDGATFALPKMVLPNDAKLADTLAKFCKENAVAAIVIGESFNDKGQENAIMPAIKSFKAEIGALTKLPTIFEKEFFTSQHAQDSQGKHDMLDASAAALILQRYLDRKANM